MGPSHATQPESVVGSEASTSEDVFLFLLLLTHIYVQTLLLLEI